MATTWTPGPVRIRRITKEGGWFEYDFITDDGAGRGTYATARFYGENHEADARLWAQAPAMADVLAGLVRAAQTVPILKEPGWDITDVADALPMMKALDSANRILRAIEEG